MTGGERGEAPGIEGRSQPWEPTFRACDHYSVGKFTGSWQELGSDAVGRGLEEGQSQGAQELVLEQREGWGSLWKGLLAMGVVLSIQPTHILDLSQQRVWRPEPCTQAGGYSGGTGALSSCNTAWMVQELFPSVAPPLYSGPWFSCLWPGAAAGPTCLMVSRACQDSGHLKQMESLTKAGPASRLPVCGSVREAEFLGTGGPATPDPPTVRPFMFRLGQDPKICSPAGPLVYLSAMQGAWGDLGFHLFHSH